MWLVKIMSLAGVAAVAWVLCLAMGQRLVGQLIVIIAIFASVAFTAEAVKPVYDEAKVKIEATQKKFDEANKKLEQTQQTYEELNQKLDRAGESYESIKRRVFFWQKDDKPQEGGR